MMKRLSISKICFVFAILCVVVFVGTHIQRTSGSYAKAAMDQSQISYISVPITASDTLSSIADQYYCQEFGSMQEYIQEIRQYNSLRSDSIYAGNHLIIPVYNRAGAPETACID